MPVLEALGELARGPSGETVVAALAQRAPTWLVELPWLLDDCPDAEAVRHRAQGATRAPDAARDARGARRDRRRDAARARARGPALGRRLDARPARRAAAPARPGAPARARDLPAGRRAAGRRARPRPLRARPVRRAAAAAAGRRRGRGLPRGALPGGAGAGGARRRARAADRRQPAVHAQPARALAVPTARWSSGRRRRSSRARARRSRRAIPPTLRAHIRDQLDRLPADDAELLQRGERRRPRLLDRDAGGRARPRPRGRRGALRRARRSARG